MARDATPVSARSVRAVCVTVISISDILSGETQTHRPEKSGSDWGAPAAWPSGTAGTARRDARSEVRISRPIDELAETIGTFTKTVQKSGRDPDNPIRCSGLTSTFACSCSPQSYV